MQVEEVKHIIEEKESSSEFLESSSESEKEKIKKKEITRQIINIERARDESMTKLAKQRNKNKPQLPDTSAIERLHFKRPRQDTLKAKKKGNSQVYNKSSTGVESLKGKSSGSLLEVPLPLRKRKSDVGKYEEDEENVSENKLQKIRRERKFSAMSDIKEEDSFFHQSHNNSEALSASGERSDSDSASRDDKKFEC